VKRIEGVARRGRSTLHFCITWSRKMVLYSSVAQGKTSGLPYLGFYSPNLPSRSHRNSSSRVTSRMCCLAILSEIYQTQLPSPDFGMKDTPCLFDNLYFHNNSIQGKRLGRRAGYRGQHLFSLIVSSLDSSSHIKHSDKHFN